jgi:Protein of unknown function (DUF779)
MLLHGSTSILRDCTSSALITASLTLGDRGRPSHPIYSDVELGEVDGEPFYMSRSQFEYWKHTHLTLDVVPGRGGMFSLDNPEGLRFLIRSRVFDDNEIRELREAGRI